MNRSLKKVEVVHYGNQTVRLSQFDGRWWVFAHDAAIQLGAGFNWSKLYMEAPEGEKLSKGLPGTRPEQWVSAIYVMQKLKIKDTPAHAKFRAWLEAWKIVNHARDHSAVD
jgi:hypothetical protein